MKEIYRIASEIEKMVYPTYAITLRQPWATLIFERGKDIENRTWLPDSRLKPGDRIWIHAGNAVDSKICEYAKIDPTDVPRGLLLGHVQYDGTCTSSNSVWWEGPIGWMISDPVRIKPVPCKGLQKIWKVPSDVISQLCSV